MRRQDSFTAIVKSSLTKNTPFWRIPPSGVWRNIAPALVSFPNPKKQKSVFATLGKNRIDIWLFILEAKGIPFYIRRTRIAFALYVPVGKELAAIWEIHGFETEKLRTVEQIATARTWWPAMLIAAFLYYWHGVRYGWYEAPFACLPTSKDVWLQMFGLDTYRTMQWGEWWRTISALFLHGGSAHLFGNMAFTVLFFPFLAQRTGVGFALFLTITGGMLGNGVAVFFKSPQSISIGFSTAIFALVGALAGYNSSTILHSLRVGKIPFLFTDSIRPVLLPLATALAILGMLGGAGKEHVDFTAHVCGLGAGFFISCIVWFPLQKLQKLTKLQYTIVQGIVGILVAMSIWYAWWRAIGSYTP